MKKIISTLLSILMAFTCITANTVLAEENIVVGIDSSDLGTVEYSIGDDTTINQVPSYQSISVDTSKTYTFYLTKKDDSDFKPVVKINGSSLESNNISDSEDSNNKTWKFTYQFNQNNENYQSVKICWTQDELNYDNFSKGDSQFQIAVTSSQLCAITVNSSSGSFSSGYNAKYNFNNGTGSVEIVITPSSGYVSKTIFVNINGSEQTISKRDLTTNNDVTYSYSLSNVNNSFDNNYVNIYAIVCKKPTAINLSGLVLKPGESENLSVSVLPEETDQEVTYVSSNSDIAEVDNTGKVTAKKIGTATITATSVIDANVYGTCTVNVSDSEVKTSVSTDCNGKLIVQYGDMRMRIGLANYSSDGQTIHIDDGTQFDLNVFGSNYLNNNTIGIAVIDGNDNVLYEASSDIYSKIEFVSVTEVGTDKLSIENSEATSSTGRSTQKIAFGYKNASNVGSNYNEKLTMKVLLKFNGIDCYFNYFVEAYKYEDKTVELPSGTDLNTAFSSTSNLLNAMGLQDNTKYNTLTVVLPDAQYTGPITINLSNLSEYCQQLVIEGKSHDTVNTIINGEVDVKAGNFQIKNINFKSTGTKTGTAIEIIPGKYVDENTSVDIWGVENCTFSNYEYALKTVVKNGENKGLISGLLNVTIDSCKYGYYFDNPIGWCTYSDWNGGGDETVTFNNCDYCIYIKNFPKTSSSFQFAMNNVRFYGTTEKDIVNETDCTFFFSGYTNNGKTYGNYYGISLSGGITANNRRTAKISSPKGTVYTNPCIMYENNGNSVLGIDPAEGLKSAIKGNLSIDPTTITKQTTIEVLADDGQTVGAWNLSPKEAEK